MLRQIDLVDKILAYNPQADEALLNRAYVYAMAKHGEQRRASGDPYISHPIEVAGILADMHLDEATIAVALLHDTIEDTDATREDIAAKFGEDISELVDALTKLKKLDLVTKRAQQAENLRRFLLATAKDIRVLLVKLADRLHNMRTLDHVPPDKRKRIAEETMELYAPLAGRMGMQDLREELEDLCFQHINPSAYATVTARLRDINEKNRYLLGTIETALMDLLAQNGVSATVSSRQKKPWSVFKKMETKGISFDSLPDLFGLRVLVESVSDCYRALGVIHQAWAFIPGRFKDYVSTPKQNDYQSLHTTVFGPSRQRIELQIRTRAMHRVAELGIAAHTLYKDGQARLGRGKVEETRAYAWLRQTIDELAKGDSAEDFLEHTKLELFQDQVFAFTPKGKIIALPRGATPIDFAYAVHTDVGDHCVGAKINGRPMPLVTQLRNGDEVAIVTSDKQLTPPSAWQQVAVTGKARSAIRRATRLAMRKQYGGIGQRILSTAFARAGKEFSPERLVEVAHRLGRKEAPDIIAAVGRGEIASGDVLKAVHPDLAPAKPVKSAEAPPKEEGWFNLRSAAGMVFKLPTLGRTRKENKVGPAVPIRGAAANLAVNFSPEGAVPGDRIVGILQPGKGIVIYPIHSPALAAFDDEPDRWVDVRWETEDQPDARYPARISVTAINVPGSLAAIATKVAQHDANIDTLTMRSTAADFTEMEVNVQVRDVRQLNGLVADLKTLDCVSAADRALG
ncbi:MAG: bifunctional (p)ppGpp synthetase/guanosine-3',5'-bis(diphosphate) 3'-pyrophosphohydrolase [Rhizobiaceae bacterium]|nr:bifunctional (p)ppGpp synthetase/guanosine-3',5'-bis(diphosphate) 3'-pyrophosphohydrolase [Rhizobiaceae bacterium]